MDVVVPLTEIFEDLVHAILQAVLASFPILAIIAKQGIAELHINLNGFPLLALLTHLTVKIVIQ